MPPLVPDPPHAERAGVRGGYIAVQALIWGQLLLWGGDTARDSGGTSPPSSASSFPMANWRLLVPGGQIPSIHSWGREPSVPRMCHETFLLPWAKPLCTPRPSSQPKIQPLGWATQAHGGFLHMGACFYTWGVSVPPIASHPHLTVGSSACQGSRSRSLSQGTAGWAPLLLSEEQAPAIAPEMAAPQALSWGPSLLQTPHAQTPVLCLCPGSRRNTDFGGWTALVQSLGAGHLAPSPRTEEDLGRRSPSTSCWPSSPCATSSELEKQHLEKPSIFMVCMVCLCALSSSAAFPSP